MTAITWLGHGSWKMVSGRGSIIYLDPWITDNPACPVSLEAIDDADLVCVTHGHNDHLGNAVEVVQQTGATLVTLPEIATYCQRFGIPYDHNGGTLHTGGSVKQLDVRINAVFALHSSDIMGREYAESGQVMAGSGTCGMVIEQEVGPTVYFAGDTGVFGDMSLIGKLYAPKIAVLPIGGKYTMGVREAAFAMELLGAEVMLPGHYDTFPGQEADTEKLAQHLAVRCPRARLEVLTPGQTLDCAQL